MDFSSQIIPAAIILVANLLGGHHSSLQWEYVTAIFGWGAVISTVAYFAMLFLLPESELASYLVQISGFCLITAISRDYERMFKQIFPWNR